MTPEEIDRLWRYHEQRLRSFDDRLDRLIEEERESTRLARERLEAAKEESRHAIQESEKRLAESLARIDRLEDYASRSFRMGVEAIRRERVERRKLEASFEQRLERTRQDSDVRMTRIERAIEALLRSKNGGSGEANGHA